MIIAFALAVILRIYPTLYYHEPYSTDSWQPIRNAQVLLADSPTQLAGNPPFDQYNIYWPANSIFGAIASLIFHASPIQVMPLIFPIIGSITILIFFLIAERVTKSSLAAFIASLLFATAGFYATFTASVTKETFANPIYMMCLYFLLARKVDLRIVGLLTLSSFILIMAHYATIFAFLAIAGSIVLVDAILSLRQGEGVTPKLLLPVITAVISIAYIFLYGYTGLSGLPGQISYATWIEILAFLVVMMVPVIYFTIGPKRSMLPLEEGIVMIAFLVALVLASRTSVISLAPVFPEWIYFLAVPYFLVGAFAIFGYRLLQRDDRGAFAFTAAWLSSVIALVGFAFLSGIPGGLGITYRLFDFLYPPAAILGAIGLVKLYSIPKSVLKVGIAALIIFIVTVSAYQTYGAAIERQNLLGGHWAYSQSEYAGALWVDQTHPSSGNFGLTGDSHVSYLYSGYFALNVTSAGGYAYLAGLSGTEPTNLVTYSLMLQNGYVLDPYSFPIAPNWLDKLDSNSTLLFSDGTVMIWR